MLFAVILFTNCTNDNTEDNVCGTILEPNGNEFTYNCSNYPTENGRLNIESTVWLDGTTSCMIELVNNPYSDFNAIAGSTNVNFIRIWLIVPVSAYYNSEIPSGTYKLKKLNSNINEQYVSMDIADWNQVAFNSNIIQPQSGSTIFNSENLIASEFDDITVDVSKTNDIYTITYFMKKGNKQIKGKFVGQMAIVDTWN